MKKTLILFLLFIYPSCLDASSTLPSGGTCDSIVQGNDSKIDISKAIGDCIEGMRSGGIIRIPPGRYRLLSPLKIDKSIIVETRSIRGMPPCSHEAETGCAVLVVGTMSSSSNMGKMPIEIEAHDVGLRSLIIEGGADRSKDWAKRICLDERNRPLAGGIRVRGNNFHLTNVVLRSFSCYTALEVISGVKGLSVTGSLIGPNGQHDIPMMWADGITVHDAANAVIKGNTFLDNTDVQLIFGGCTECIVQHNRFRHSSSLKHAAFAELMLHAWGNTSGDFSGSLTSQNNINCGRFRRCGYGIMVGGEPWYPAKTFGGTLSANKVSNAQLGINVDRLTGGMIIRDNSVTMSGGMANSDCGRRVWPAINVSRESRKFLTTDINNGAAIETRGCLLNHNSG